MDGDVGSRSDLVDGSFNRFSEIVRLRKGLTAVDQDMEIHKQYRAGISQPHLVAISHTGDALYGGGDALFHAFRGAIKQSVDGAAP
jgi:hypothetical protein